MARLLFERKIVKEARHSVYEMTSFTAILRRLYAVTFQFTTVVTNAVVSSFFFLPPFPVPPPHLLVSSNIFCFHVQQAILFMY